MMIKCWIILILVYKELSRNLTGGPQVPKSPGLIEEEVDVLSIGDNCSQIDLNKIKVFEMDVRRRFIYLSFKSTFTTTFMFSGTKKKTAGDLIKMMFNKI